MTSFQAHRGRSRSGSRYWTKSGWRTRLELAVVSGWNEAAGAPARGASDE